MEEASSWETQEDRHPSTLISIINMIELPERMGKLEEARPLYEEELQAKRETLGDRHPDPKTQRARCGMARGWKSAKAVCPPRPPLRYCFAPGAPIVQEFCTTHTNLGGRGGCRVLH